MRFTRLRLRNWRNFRAVDIALEARTFIVGPNASGKSNLIDSLRFIAEIAQPGSGGLRAAVESRGGYAAVRSIHARRPDEIEIEVTAGTEDSPRAWSYRLTISAPGRSQSPMVQAEQVVENGVIVVDRTPDASDPLQATQTFLEQTATNRPFRPLVELLASSRYLHVVPQIMRDRARARREGEDPFGGDLLRRMKAMPQKTRTPRLNRIGKALALAVPQFDGLELEDDADGVPHLLASFKQWRAGKSKQSETFFSDGTLRFIGLLWSISEKGGPLLLEEPELSLNDAVVAELPKMFSVMQRLSQRQVIATTHSPSLLDDTGVALREIQRITVDSNGSSVETAADNPVVAAQVQAGMSASEAILPLVAPSNLAELGRLKIAG